MTIKPSHCLLSLSLFAALALALPASAADKKEPHTHDHAHTHAPEKGHTHDKKLAGPNGGRVLTKSEPHAEFFITAERKVQITFLGEDGKAIAPAGQIVTVTTGDRTAPTKLTFAPSGNVLVSDHALPAGNAFPAVVQIKAKPDAKAVTEKFTIDLSRCGGCDKAEYACTCAH